MPNYKTHTLINLSICGAASWSLLSYGLLAEQLITAYGISFLTATFFLSPDLDLQYSRPSRNWGLLRWIWKPYHLVSKHRGISHSIFLGTLSRALYLGAVLTIMVLALQYFSLLLKVSFMFPLLAAPIDYVLNIKDTMAIASIAGVFNSDLAHILTDKFASAAKALMR